MATKNLGRLNYLDGMRAVAALYVMAHHGLMTIWSLKYYRIHGWRSWAFGWLLYGGFAVDLFIVLSGYCLMLPALRNGYRLSGSAIDFFRRRAWRILPAYYGALALSLGLIILYINDQTFTHWDFSIPVTRQSLLAHLFLIHDFRGGNTINYVLWSIAVEWHIYFLFPLLLWFMRRVNPLFVTIAVFPICWLAPAFFGRINLDSQVPTYFALFVLGTLAATIVHSPEAKWGKARLFPWKLIFCIYGTLWAAAIAIKGVDLWKISVTGAEWSGGVAAGLGLLAISQSARVQKILGAPILVTIGGFSYSIYLIHAPLLQLIWKWCLSAQALSKEAQFLLLEILAIPSITLAAYAFSRIFEAPFMRPPHIGNNVKSNT